MTSDSKTETKGKDKTQSRTNAADANQADANKAVMQAEPPETAEAAAENGQPASSPAKGKGSGAAADELKRQVLMKQSLQSKIMSANFGNIVSMLMQSPAHKNITLEDLPTRIVTPLVNNQFLLAEAYKKDTGYTFPVGMVLWARVSDEVDRKLAEDLDKPIHLEQDEWTGGDNYWLVESVGEQRFVQQLLSKLCKDVFKDKPIKARVADKDGNRRVEVFNTGEK